LVSLLLLRVHQYRDMANKVKLDILDFEETIVTRADLTEVDKGKKTGLFKWLAFRWYLPSFIVIASLLSVGVFSYRWAGTEKTAKPRGLEKAVKSAPPSHKVNTAFLNDFLIALNDDKGNNRVLACDVAVELDARNYPEFLSNVAEARKIIYKTVEKKSLTTLLKPESKGLMKNEINAGLATLFGKNAVKTVYLTKFVVL
jgi:flagellar basal body-associated protein FliL